MREDLFNRRYFIKQAGVVTAGAALGAGSRAAPAIAQAQPEIKWRLASDYPKQLDIIYGGAELLAKRVGEASGGRFQIEVSPTNDVVPTLGLLNAMKDQTVEMGQTASYNYFNVDPTFALGTAVPFGLNSRLQNAWMYHGGGLDLLNEFYAKYDIHMLLGGNTGGQMGGWFRKEINSLADLNDLKFRVGGFAGRVLAKLGVEPTALPVAQIQSAFESGKLDAAELVGPYDDEKFGLNKVASHYYYPGWWEGGAMLVFFINTAAWNDLPDQYKSILETASAAVNADMQARYDAANPPALRRLVESGAELHSFSPEILEACFSAANEVYDEISAENEDFRTIYESMAAFRGEAYASMRITDGAFNAFMYEKARTGAL